MSEAGPSAVPQHRRLLRIEDVADRLAVSTKTVRRMVASGQLEAVHIGAAVRFTEAAVERFITSVSKHRAKLRNPDKTKA